MNKLARRIHFFRQRKKISQMDLELKIGAAFGSISRIESGKINPTKETIEKISKALKLNEPEISYLIGPHANPATKEEIVQAMEEVVDYFSKPFVYSFLVDERERLFLLSKGFINCLTKQDQVNIDRIYGKTKIELLINPKFNMRKYFEGKQFDKTLTILLYYYTSLNYMYDDQHYISALECIKRDSNANIIWQRLTTTMKKPLLVTKNLRRLYFSLHGIPFSFSYSNEPVPNHPRFTVVEFTPTNKFIHYFTRVLSPFV